jgi:hypothetical protein
MRLDAVAADQSRYHLPLWQRTERTMRQSTVLQWPRRDGILGILFIFAAAGCHRNSMNEIEKSGTPEGVRFTAEASVSPDKADTVFVALRATNRSSGYRTVVFLPVGRCGVSVAFATGRGKATRVWRLQSPPMKLPSGVVEGCDGGALMAQFGPGGSVYTVRTAMPVRAILGDTLPPGLYRAVIGADSLLRGGYVSSEIALR